MGVSERHAQTRQRLAMLVAKDDDRDHCQVFRRLRPMTGTYNSRSQYRSAVTYLKPVRSTAVDIFDERVGGMFEAMGDDGSSVVARGGTRGHRPMV